MVHLTLCNVAYLAKPVFVKRVPPSTGCSGPMRSYSKSHKLFRSFKFCAYLRSTLPLALPRGRKAMQFITEVLPHRSQEMTRGKMPTEVWGGPSDPAAVFSD